MEARELLSYDFRRVDLLLFGFVEGFRKKGGNLKEGIIEFQRAFCIAEDDVAFTALKAQYHRLSRKANKTLRQNLDFEDDALLLRREHTSLINQLKNIIIVNSSTGSAASDDRI
jgi:hypothetical protein